MAMVMTLSLTKPILKTMTITTTILRIAPVVQVVNLEFCLCLSPRFEPQVGRTFDFICKNKDKK